MNSENIETHLRLMRQIPQPFNAMQAFNIQNYPPTPGGYLYHHPNPIRQMQPLHQAGFPLAVHQQSPPVHIMPAQQRETYTIWAEEPAPKQRRIECAESHSAGPNLAGEKKSKRTRTAYTSQQLAELERGFQRCLYISRPQRAKMAQELNLSEQQIKVWYQNRRTKFKKENNSNNIKKPDSLQQIQNEAGSKPPSTHILDNNNKSTANITSNTAEETTNNAVPWEIVNFLQNIDTSGTEQVYPVNTAVQQPTVEAAIVQFNNIDYTEQPDDEKFELYVSYIKDFELALLQHDF